MDSLSQIALGAAVGVAVMGRRTALWKSALWGGVCGTLPDLDALIDHDDAVLNMTRHRAESHALAWLTLASPAIAWVVARAAGEPGLARRWWLAVWAVLVTHPLLDAMTVYGTQLALPFSDYPYGVASLFIVDPLYTLPLLAGIGVALRGGPNALRWNAIGLALSTAYVGWSVLAQQHVSEVARESLAMRDGAVARDTRILVTPTAFNTLLWRVVVMHDDRYEEGFRSLLDRTPTMRFDAFPNGRALYETVRTIPSVERMARFTHGFFRVAEADGRLVLTDLRMGQEPWYAFSFVVAARGNPGLHPVVPVNVGGRRGLDVAASLRRLRVRALGTQQAPPR